MSDDKTPAHALTPDTAVKMPLARLWTIIVAVVVAASVAAGAYGDVKGEVRGHVGNIHIHLGDKFESEHGLPVGTWDLINLERRLDEQRVKDNAELRAWLEAAIAKRPR